MRVVGGIVFAVAALVLVAALRLMEGPVDLDFLKDRIAPQNGCVALPTAPGLGMDLDETKVRERREIMGDG